MFTKGVSKPRYGFNFMIGLEYKNHALKHPLQVHIRLIIVLFQSAHFIPHPPPNKCSTSHESEEYGSPQALLMYITDLEELLASNFLAMCYFLFKGVFLGIDSVGATNFCNNNRLLAGCILTEEKKMQTTNGRRKLGMPFMLCTLELLLCRVFCIFLSMDAFRGECALWKQCINKIMCTVCTCLPLIHMG